MHRGAYCDLLGMAPDEISRELMELLLAGDQGPSYGTPSMPGVLDQQIGGVQAHRLSTAMQDLRLVGQNRGIFLARHEKNRNGSRGQVRNGAHPTVKIRSFMIGLSENP